MCEQLYQPIRIASVEPVCTSSVMTAQISSIFRSCAAMVFEGQSLDVEVFSTLPIVEDFLKTHGPIFQRASILFDDADGLGKSFLNTVQNALSKGKNLSSIEYNNRFLRMSRVLDKLLGAQNNPVLFFMHAGVFAELGHRFWFEFKSEWSQPPYIGLPRIQLEDPAFYNLLSGLSGEMKQPLRMNYAFEIYKSFFPKSFQAIRVSRPCLKLKRIR